MRLILVYDVGQERVGKMLKLCRRYLNWIQNSVFEGELPKSKLDRLRGEIRGLIEPEHDSVIIFRFEGHVGLEREVLGLEKGGDDIFL